MSSIDQLIECFQEHIDPNDKISHYTQTKSSAAGRNGYLRLDQIRNDEKLLVFMISVRDEDNDTGKIEIGKCIGWPLDQMTVKCYTLPRSTRDVPQVGDKMFWILGGDYSKNNFNECIYARVYDHDPLDIIQVVVNGIRCKRHLQDNDERNKNEPHQLE